jgi:RNA polymerase sigma-70 factor (ECF subfamily)
VVTSAAVAPQDSTDLLDRARGGSADALNLLYERSAARLLGYIRARLGRDLRARAESRDILQAALLKSVKNLDAFRGQDPRAFQAWLARIAEHEIRDRADHQHRQRRDAAREVPLEDEAPVPALTRSALSRILLDERARRLEQALDTLPPDHRQVILMRKFEELSFAEIGARLGRSEDAARMLFARAMTTLTLALSEAQR